VFLGSEASEGLQPLGEVVCVKEGGPVYCRFTRPLDNFLGTTCRLLIAATVPDLGHSEAYYISIRGEV
jgi:hypothetical protein